MYINRVSALVLASAIMWATISGVYGAEGKENTMETLRVGVVLYPGFELLDIFGPVEMFYNVGPKLDVVMIAENAGPVASGSGADPNKPGPKAVADYSFDDAPELDLILVPGGFGSLREVRNPAMMAFLKERAPKARITSSVCSGSGILAAAGLLDNRPATSNKQFFSLITKPTPNVKWVEKARWVDDGEIITSSGVSAGIDMALAIIERLYGTEAAEDIANMTEYEWHRDPHVDPFVKFLK
jgi:transcriptional regulator GlxA family with amidase domain